MKYLKKIWRGVQLEKAVRAKSQRQGRSLKCLRKSKKVSAKEREQTRGRMGGKEISPGSRVCRALLTFAILVFWLFLIVRSQVFGGFILSKEIGSTNLFYQALHSTEFRIKWGRARWKKGVRGFLHSSWWNMMDQDACGGAGEKMVTFWIVFWRQRE